MKLHKIIIVMLVCFALLGVSHRAHAATFTVDSLLDTDDATLDGVCDDGDGNCTLRAAITEANDVSGEDIIVLGISGTTISVTPYDLIEEPITITGEGYDFIIEGVGTSFPFLFSGDGTSNNNLSYFSVTNFVTNGFSISGNNTFDHITITGHVNNSATLIEVYGDYNTFTNMNVSLGGLGFRIFGDHNTVSDSVSHDNSHSGMTTYDGDHNQFLRNHIYNIGDFGIFNIYGSSYTVIEDNTIENIGGGSGQAAFTIGELGEDLESNIDVIFRGNTISSTAGFGMTIAHAQGGLFTENTMTNTTGGGIYFGGATPETITGTITISNNTMTGSDSSGINFSSAQATFVIDGNTIDSHDSYGIYIGSDMSSSSVFTISNNDILNNGFDGINASFPFQNSTITGNTIVFGASTGNGINLNGSSNITIGGDILADRNFIYSSESGSGGAINFNYVQYPVGVGPTYYVHDITIKNNYINTDETGLVTYGGGAIRQNIIDDPDSNNLISNITVVDNLVGSGTLQIGNADNVVIQGNTLGIKSNGTEMFVGDEYNFHIQIQYSQNVTIGGSGEDQGNVVADGGGSSNGISLTSVTSASIAGNIVGFYADGVTPAGTFSGNAIVVNYSTDITVGGATSSYANVIAGGVDNQFNLNLFATTNTTVQNNYIGVGSDGTTKHAGGVGILVIYPSDTLLVTENTIHGDVVGVYAINPTEGVLTIEGNTIFDTSLYGILVGNTTLVDESNTASYATILGNSIYNNGEYGIAFGFDSSGDIMPDDITTYLTNDAGDADSGHNDYLNHPVLISATQAGSDVTLSYALDVPTGTYRVEFFTNPTYGAHASGYGEGEVYETYETRTISSSGQQVFTATLTGVTAADDISATITECTDAECTTYGPTSRFSMWDDTIPVPEPEPEPESQQVITVISVGRIQGYTPFLAPSIPSSAPVDILGSGTCPAHLIIHDFMKQGDRDGKYSAYNKRVVKDVKILQAHINRILKAQYAQASGPEDGIFGRLTKQGVMRLQTALNTILKPVPVLKIDGIVGPFTRAAINNSCGGM